MGDSSKIAERMYYAVDVRLTSPLCVSSGEKDVSDKDVIQNAKGEVFVPGTSLAGAFRNYIGDRKKEDSPFGYSEGEKGRMSSIFISDLYFDKETEKDKTRLSIRDGVQLTEDKEVSNKFDMQVIETGAKGTIYIECIRRQSDKWGYQKEIQKVIIGLQNGEIRLGTNKNRGYGRLKILAVRFSSFDSLHTKDWLEFKKKERDRRDTWSVEKEKEKENESYKTECEKISYYKEIYSSFQEWKDSIKANIDSQYITVRVPLKLTGGISIRKYSAKPEEVDFEQLTVGTGEYKRAVIPGTSWNGAIRADIRNILKEVHCQKVNEIIQMWFGWCDEKSDKEKSEKNRQSMIVISESKLESSHPLTMFRNKIDRFTEGTVKTALYSERAYVGGKTELVYMVRKDKDNILEYKALLAMMELVVADIQEGYVAIGGQVSVGRGIFRKDEEYPELIYSEQVDREECQKALYELVKWEV